ncbi:M67 family metallopeptidase [Candidatus Poribacteria bacterium]|nr:M67 family metallopeptidase [Candidatus Poribacteria bacterium]
MIEIRKDIYDQMVKEAIQSFPKECCGILAGKDGVASRIYSVKNVDPTPETAYLMDPNIQFRVLKNLDKIYIDMLAIYHSHPSSECYPSQKDIETAEYPDSVYIIISLADFESPETKAFKIINGKVVEDEIKLV